MVDRDIRADDVLYDTGKKVRFAYKTLQFISINIENTQIKKALENAIQLCNDFFVKNCSVADELYETLVNEDDGFTITQESEQNEDVRLTLDCIIDSIAIITKTAYDKIGQKYYPEPIESVSQETFIHLLNSLQKCYGEDIICKIKD